jgi:hypothetical protein
VPIGQELTCLHAAQDGEIWSVEPGGNPRPFLYLNNPMRLRSGTYRVVGCPANFKLITELYSTLNKREDESIVLVGSPTICQGQNQGVEQILACISTLNVHDNLKNCWHAVGSRTFNTLLLQYFHAEGINDLVGNIYGHHCLKRYFSFMGLNSLKLAAQLISEIVDPRWYFNPRRPYRLSRLESYFGLKPAQFRRVRGEDASRLHANANQQRTLLLLDIVKSLPEDGFVVTEAAGIQDEVVRIAFMCRQVLGFIARGWLTELGLPGYLDPVKFFKQTGNVADYRRQFKE